MSASELRCPSCKVPLVFNPRCLIELPDGRQRISPAVYCTRCEHAEEWPGYDFIAVTSDAVQIVAAVRQALVSVGGPAEVIEVLTHVIQRFNHQINRELARLLRVRLGIR